MEKNLNDYLEKIEKYLKPLPISERVDIVKEIKSEILELQGEGKTAEHDHTSDTKGEIPMALATLTARVDEKDRIVYHMENGRLYIAHCSGHYGDK